MYEVDDVRLVVERVAALDPGKRLWRSACAPPAAARPADAGAARLRHHHRAAVGDGGLAAAVARAASGKVARAQPALHLVVGVFPRKNYVAGRPR